MNKRELTASVSAGALAVYEDETAEAAEAEKTEPTYGDTPVPDPHAGGRFVGAPELTLPEAERGRPQQARGPPRRNKRGPYGLSITEAGAMIGLSRTASYAAAVRGDIPTIARYQKGPSGHGAAVARSDRGDACRYQGRATDHGARRRVQAIYPRPH